MMATCACGCPTSCGSTMCGCCAGITIAVPVSEVNPPGQPSLIYRVGTYATFYESLVARLTGFKLTITDLSGGTKVLTPLAGLTTRDPSDFTLALFDAWATVADVLTFYQERIANEGYLATALQLRSVIEMGRLIGYRPRPGVAASVKLAFTVANGFQGTLPAGTRAQSIPQAGQNPQFFETSVPLYARDTWNALSPELTRQQLITPAATDANGVPVVTGADVIDTIYFDGLSTNLSTGNALLFIFGPDASATPQQQYLRFAADVEPQAQTQRTAVTLALVVPQSRNAATELQLYLNDASYLFPGSDLASRVATILQTVIANLSQGATSATLQAAASRIALIRGIAVQRNFTRLSAWLTNLLKLMQWASLGGESTVLNAFTRAGVVGTRGAALKALPPALMSAPLANLDGVIDQLAQPPSVQPLNAYRLQRSIKSSFTPQSDLAPRLLAALHPAAAASLYAAYAAIATPTGSVQVYAARAKAGLFAANWTGPGTYAGGTTTYAEPQIQSAWANSFPDIADGVSELPLDQIYDQIEPGSWVAIDRPQIDANTPATTTFHVVTSLRTANLSAGAGAQSGETASGSGFTAKATLLTLQPPWLSDLTSNYSTAIDLTAVLRQTIVHAQSEALAITDEPLDTDISGDTIDLDGVYDGLQAGRWIIVSGTRTDIPNVSGVTATELAMIAGVVQGSQTPLCAVWTLSTPPFSQILYTTDANAFGDRLVVGTLAVPGRPPGLAAPTVLNQQFCDQVELAPGVYANAYVPTSDELNGEFPTFLGLLVDPQTNVPFDNGQIPPARVKDDGLFAWRVSSNAVHTILTLASPLAYTYDRSTITIYGNIVDATQGQSTGEVLGNGNATVAYPSFELSQLPLTYVSAPTPSGVSSTLSVQVNELYWTELNDLAEASATNRVFITSQDDSGDTTVTFGNGVHGRRLPTGTANVKATYRYGMGSSGNVAAGQISQLATMPLGAQGVTNPLPATGGADADPIDRARANAPIAVMALDRLVSVADYANFTRTYAGIGKAVSVKLTDGRRQLVHITIAGAEDIPIDTNSDLYANLLQSLNSFGDPSLPVEVAICRVRLLVMAATVGLMPDYVWDDVVPNVTSALQALFAFDARALGQTAYLSEAIAAAQQVEGVAWVNFTTFDGVAQSTTAAQLAALASSLRRRPYVQASLGEIDPKAAPGSANRILPAELVFMTADIPEMLILTQGT
jgi:Baseplate J-like protein